MRYEKAKAEVVMFDNSDVITTSNCAGQNHDNGCPKGQKNQTNTMDLDLNW